MKEDRSPRWLVRALVLLTALLCLGVAGYGGQVWWAKRVAVRIAQEYFGPVNVDMDRSINFLSYWDREQAKKLIKDWRQTPWYGKQFTLGLHYCFAKYPVVWVTPRVYAEVARVSTNQVLPNDPSAWEAWFKAHPNLIWDEKLNRLVDRP